MKINYIFKIMIFFFVVLIFVNEAESSPILKNVKGEILKVSKSKKLISISCDPETEVPKENQVVVIREGVKNLFKARFIKNKDNKCAFEIKEKLSSVEPKKGMKIKSYYKADEELALNKPKKTRKPEIFKDDDLDKDITPEEKKKIEADPELDVDTDKEDSPESKSKSKNKSKKKDSKILEDGTQFDEDEFFADFDESEIESYSSVIYEPFDYGISLMYGKIKNKTYNDTYGAFGGKLHYNIAKKVLLKRETQDSLTIEGGLYYYSVEDISKADSNGNIPTFRVFPLFANFRYNVHLVPGFIIYPYAGYSKVVMKTFNNADGRSVLPASQGLIYGAGLQMKVSTGWSLRVDVGNDGSQFGFTILF